MNKLNKIEEKLIYILECAVNSIIPDKEKIKNIDLDQLFKICEFNKITSIIGNMLEKAGINNNNFNQEKQKAIRNQIYYNAERNQIFNEFEKNQIWYMPLKGIILKNLYPESEMRQMADNDILFDSTKQELVKKIMLKLKFEIHYMEKYDHDVYYKNNLLNFEMHKELYGKYHKQIFHEYYQNIKEKLIKDENTEYGFHFTDEDFYIYMLSHDYKHFKLAGTGLRGLLDCYVFLNKKENNLNWKYIFQELNKLDLIDFERERREFSKKLFKIDGLKELNEKEYEILKNFINLGAYGTQESIAKRRISNYFDKENSNSKIKYLLNRLFPKIDYIQSWYPTLCKFKILIPIAYIWRIVKKIATKGKKIKLELNEVINYDSSSI